MSLPQGTVIDLSSLKAFMKVQTQSPGTAGGAGDVVYARLPADIATLFQNIQVLVNGVMINGSTNEYNSCHRMRKLCAGTVDRDQTVSKTVSHGSIVSDDANEQGDYCFNDWLHTLFAGGKEGASTRFLHTGLVGDIQLRLQFAGNNVLCGKQDGVSMTNNYTSADARTNAAQMTYSFSDIYFTVDAISMPPEYEVMLQKAVMMAPLEVDYEEAYSWNLNNITADAFENRFSLSSRSVNKLLAGVRDANYQTTGIRASALVGNYGDALVSNYQRFRAYPDPPKTLQWNYTLNGQLHPNYPAELLEAAADCAYVEDKCGVSGKGTLIGSTESFQDGMCVFPLRLDLPVADNGHPASRLASGFDCRSTNSSMSFSVKGMSTPTADPASGETAVRSCIVAAITQPKLMISPGKSVSVSL